MRNFLTNVRPVEDDEARWNEALVLLEMYITWNRNLVIFPLSPEVNWPLKGHHTGLGVLIYCGAGCRKKGRPFLASPGVN